MKAINYEVQLSASFYALNYVQHLGYFSDEGIHDLPISPDVLHPDSSLSREKLAHEWFTAVMSPFRLIMSCKVLACSVSSNPGERAIIEQSKVPIRLWAIRF